MEWMAVVVGFALRLGLPLGLTLLLVWWLRRLDARWQAEAGLERQSLAPEARPRASPGRCWEVRGCPPERRAACPAFARPDVWCWQIFRDSRGRLKEACLVCDIFLRAPVQPLLSGQEVAK